MQLSGHASQASIYATIIALTVVSSVAVLLRLTTRLAIVKQSGWDDVFISIACLLSIAMGVSICMQANFGMGLHIATLPEWYIHTAFKWFWNFLWLYYGSLCFTKLSILLQYLRIFPQRTFIRACYVLIAIVSVWSCWAVFSSIFTCVPVSRFWTDLDWDTTGCLPRQVLWYVNAAVNIATDCATALLPIPIINSLDIPKKQKILLRFVFAVGLFTCLISILRLVYIYPLTVSPDFTWQSPLPTIWSCVETNTAILCSCVPTLKGLLQRFFPKALGSVRSRQTAGGTGATDSTLDSTMKSDVELKVMEKSNSVTRQKVKRFSAFGSKKGKTMDDYRGEDRSENGSEEAIVEYSAMPGQFVTMAGSQPRVSEDRSIHVQTSVSLTSRPWRTSDPKPPKKYEAVGGVHSARVFGAGRTVPHKEDPPSWLQVDVDE